jgi:hypothetical protein
VRSQSLDLETRTFHGERRPRSFIASLMEWCRAAPSPANRCGHDEVMPEAVRRSRGWRLLLSCIPALGAGGCSAFIGLVLMWGAAGVSGCPLFPGDTDFMRCKSGWESEASWVLGVVGYGLFFGAPLVAILILWLSWRAPSS